jgi:small subunit ribosomal protein S13
MFRVSGYILKSNKELYIAMKSIYGIGIKTSIDICKALNISYTIRVKDIDPKFAIILTEHVNQNYIIGDDLKKQILAHKKKYIAINCYRGKRLRLGLPCRGQKTRSNAKTVRALHKKII